MNPSDKLNILHIISSSNIGGSPVHTLLLCEELEKLGHHPVLIYPEGGSFEVNYKKSKITKYSLPNLSPFRFHTYRFILRIIKCEKINIIHTHELRADLIGYFLQIFLNCPVVTTIHNMITHSRLSPMKKKIYCFYSRKIYNSISGVITVSDSVKSNILHELNARNSNIRTIHNGTKTINLSKLSQPAFTRDIYGISSGIPLLLCIGRLIPVQKGQEFIIRAMPDILKYDSSVHLLIIGDGIIRADLVKLVNKLQLESQITFGGWQHNIHDILHACDVCIVPSLWDPFPRIILEAMMTAKPVVASNVDGIKEVVIHNETGLLVEPKDSVALAKAVIHLLENPDLKLSMGLKARTHILNNFTSEHHATHTLNFYKTILEGKRDS